MCCMYVVPEDVNTARGRVMYNKAIKTFLKLNRTTTPLHIYMAASTSNACLGLGWER